MAVSNTVAAFERYLQQYKINPVDLSAQAQVRYRIVYNAQKGNPILPENAQKIKDAVLRLTGVPYTGSFVLKEELSASQSPIPPGGQGGVRHGRYPVGKLHSL